MDAFEAFMDLATRTPPRPDKPSMDSIKHPMYKDLDGRYWPIVQKMVEMGVLMAGDIQLWDEEVDGEIF